ncbi:MAG: lipopolysaccharide biosynthesis protein [Bacteroidota bacterium]|jgi:O-antigen/teichoic acid export membrane protein
MFGRFNRHQDLVKSILTLFTGSAIAQAIPILVSPLLTRLYPVVDFAALTIITTLISLVGVVVTGRYEFAVGLPADDRDGRSLVQLASVITVSVSILVGIILVFFRDGIASLMSFPSSPDYLFAIPVAALFYGGYQAFSFWQIRQRNYVVVSGSRISQSLTNSASSLAIFFIGFGINGLILGNVLGQFAAFLYAFLSTAGRFKDFLVKPVSDLKVVAGRYADMPKVNSIHALSDVGQSTAVILMITGIFGSVSTGLYGLTMRILQAPLNMIGNSLAMVFYKEVSEKTINGQLISKLLLSTMRTLFLISLPVFLLLMVFGPDLFALVFGSEWRDAGLYARIMSPWLMLNFIASPLSNLPIILSKQRAFFVYSLIGNSIVIASLAIAGWLFNEIKSGLIVLSAVQCLFQLSMIVFFFRIAKEADQKNNSD